MNINLELYRLFYDVAITGNISKTAEKLFISQPAVTQSIQKLEEQLGGKLFYRVPKGVMLTEEGQRLFEYLKNSIETLNNAENKFGQFINLEEGKIRIKTGSMIGNSFLYDAIIEFSKKYPNIQIEISSGLTSRCMDELSAGEVDLVALNLPYEDNRENIEIIECKKVKECFFASKEYLESLDFEVKTYDDLKKCSLILPKPPSNTREIFDRLCKEKGIKLTPRFEISSSNARIYFAKKSLGIALGLKNLVNDYFKKGELIEVDVMEFKNRGMGVAKLKDNICSMPTLKLVETIKSMQE